VRGEIRADRVAALLANVLGPPLRVELRYLVGVNTLGKNR